MKEMMAKCEPKITTADEQTSSSVADVLGSMRTTLAKINVRIGNMETKLEATSEVVKRLEARITSTNRDNAKELDTEPPTSMEASPERRRAPPSPKTMMILMEEEEKEEQQRALEQIDDRFEESRPWYACVWPHYIKTLTATVLNAPNPLASRAFADNIFSGVQHTRR